MLQIERILALLAGTTKRDVEREAAKLVPAQRQKLAQTLRFIADIIEPPHKSLPAKAPKVPKSGVIADILSGAPRHE